MNKSANKILFLNDGESQKIVVFVEDIIVNERTKEKHVYLTDVSLKLTWHPRQNQAILQKQILTKTYFLETSILII